VSSWNEAYARSGDGTRLYTRRREAPGPVTSILCDGIACDGFIWRYLAEDLLRWGAVGHWNYRGHGRSAAPEDPDHISTAALADDLEAAWDVLDPGGEPVVLFGHSLGCQIVLEGYRRRPEAVAGLVLICGAPGRVTHSFKGSDALAQALPGVIERVRRNPRIARALWSNVPPEMSARVAVALGEVDAAVSADDIVLYSDHVRNIDLEMFLRMLQRVGEETAEDVLSTIEVPTLVLAGELDSFTPTHLAEEMAAAIPDSELVIFPSATHVVPVERRDEVLERLTRFFEERLLPRLEGLSGEPPQTTAGEVVSPVEANRGAE